MLEQVPHMLFFFFSEPWVSTFNYSYYTPKTTLAEGTFSRNSQSYSPRSCSKYFYYRSTVLLLPGSFCSLPGVVKETASLLPLRGATEEHYPYYLLHRRHLPPLKSPLAIGVCVLLPWRALTQCFIDVARIMRSSIWIPPSLVPRPNSVSSSLGDDGCTVSLQSQKEGDCARSYHRPVSSGKRVFFQILPTRRGC